jgi:hypothetical protein
VNTVLSDGPAAHRQPSAPRCGHCRRDLQLTVRDGSVLEDLSRYQIVLTEGRFVDAEGFSLSEDGRIATPLAPPTSSGAAVRLVLSWVDES